MQKSIRLPAFALLSGAVGYALRSWQLTTVLDTRTELFRSGMPATYALLGFTALIALLVLLACRGGASPQDYPQAFSCPSTLYVTVAVTAGLLLFAAAALCALECYTQLVNWSYGLDSLPATLILITVGCVCAGAVTIMLGQQNYRQSHTIDHPILTTIPPFACLPWLIFIYQQHARDPVELRYAFSLLAAVCICLGLYFTCCFAYKRANSLACLFFCLMAVYFNLLTLADGLALYQVVTMLAFVLLLISNAIALLDNRFHPYQN